MFNKYELSSPKRLKPDKCDGASEEAPVDVDLS